jgi:hypothetical protein
MGQTQNPKIRCDGWTAERQLCFLDALAQTRSVTKATRAAGMSREGAYRFLARNADSLFAALWDRALAMPLAASEVHTGSLSTGRLMRLLGTRFRRERGDFRNIGSARAKARAG